MLLLQVQSKALSRQSSPSNGMSADWIFIALRLMNSGTAIFYRNQKTIVIKSQVEALDKVVMGSDNLECQRHRGLLLCHRACKRSPSTQTRIK